MKTDETRTESPKPSVPVLVVVGPTASGKTELAARLARLLDGEVISADSMQIYRGMPVATAVPDESERLGVPHHLLEFLDPSRSFSVAAYAEAAHRTVRDVHARGKLPVLAGGTGLYVSAVLDNIEFPEHGSSAEIRERLRREAEREGPEAMHRRLAAVDPESAARLHPANLGRVLRALEIHELTGISMTEHLARSRRNPTPYAPLILGLNFENRALLYDRIDRRVDKMVRKGLVEEARRAYERGVAGTASLAIGHKELFGFFAGEATLEEALDRLKRQTRRYAKRQLTWFRHMPGVHWIYRDQTPDAVGEALRILRAENFVPERLRGLDPDNFTD